MTNQRLPQETLTAQAAASQTQISTNSYNSLPFTTVSDTLISELGAPQLAQTSNENNIKAKLTPYGKIIKDLCTAKCKTILENQLAEQKDRTDTKLSLFSLAWPKPEAS